MAAPGVPIRPELIRLTAAQRDRVRTETRRHRATCAGCGHREFTIGDALYVGFLFRREDVETYLVALTCANPDCPAPRTGVRLRRSQFLGG